MASRQPTPERVREILRALYGPCALCGETLRGHELAFLASVIVTESGESEATLRSVIAAQDWQRAATFQEWRGDADELEYRLIRCPWSRQLTILEIRAFTALDFDDIVLSRTVLSNDASLALQEQTSVAWEKL